MSTKESYDEYQCDKDDSYWLPFKQYTGSQDEQYKYKWTEHDINQLITRTFIGQIKQNDDDINKLPLDTASAKLCTEGIKTTHEKQEIIGTCTCECGSVKSNCALPVNEFGCKLFRSKASEEYWERLLHSVVKKKSPKKIIFLWKQSYLKALPLHEHMEEKDDGIALENLRDFCKTIPCLNGVTTECLTSLTSDESDSDECEKTLWKCDPMYSRFGELRNAFHTSEDGVVFCSQRELDRYKLKMAEMKEVFDCELELLKHQHDQLRAKRTEEHKLLSERMSMNQEQDLPEYEPTEKDNLNTDNNKQSSKKEERKSALFSSIHDAFSYARTGIQGIFVKNSPSGSRKVRGNDEYSDSSDEEEEKLGSALLSQNPDALEDYHDAFTRKMTSDGGLKYQSSDKTDQQLSYQNLPPPLSLNTLPAKAKT